MFAEKTFFIIGNSRLTLREFNGVNARFEKKLIIISCQR